MSFLHLNVLDFVEDLDTEGKPRLRAKVQEVKPRIINMNLKSANSEHINMIRSLVGGSAMFPVREGLYNGQPYFSFQADEEIIPVNKPEKIPVSKTVELTETKPNDKKALNFG